MRMSASFPVAWHGAVVGLGRPLADGSRIDDLSQSAFGGAAFGLAHLPRCTQVRHQRLLQHAACLDKETPIAQSGQIETVCCLSAFGGKADIAPDDTASAFDPK